MTQGLHAVFVADSLLFRPLAARATRANPTQPYWTDSALESVLRDVDDQVILKVRALAAGGVSARWTNGRQWDNSDQVQKGPALSPVRWFETLRLVKAAAAALL